MTKKIIARILLVTSSILTLIGVGLMWSSIATSEEANEITVHVEDSFMESVEFKDLVLIPGESCEYTIKLKGEAAKQYDISLDFVETEEKTLKNFAYVKIISADEVICDMLLADAFEDDSLVLPVDFSETKNTELTIIYYLPENVGNEAKNAEALFELHLSAEHE